MASANLSSGMSRRAKILLAITLGVVVGAVLYLRVLAHHTFFESFGSEQEARTKLSQLALQPQGGPNQPVVLYFPDYNNGTLLGEARSLSWPKEDVDRSREILLGLIEGSHKGYASALPPSATIRALFLTSDGTAVIDFSSDVRNGLDPGIESEALAVYSLVDSLAANIPSVKKVRILVQGQEVETLDGHIDLSEAFEPNPDLIRKAD